MSFNCGIVGLPNVGKSTLFNALTKTAAAAAANYPFCTIEPNVGRVPVPDLRLEPIARLAKSKEVISTQLEIKDIAGLVRGASKGEGLGNQFLGAIREVDAILHVVRCFEDNDITHVEGTIDPIRDAELIEVELLLADIESLERQREGLVKRVRGLDKEAKTRLEVLDMALPEMQLGKSARSLPMGGDDRKVLRSFNLLTTKPVLFICNVEEDSASSGNYLSQAMAEFSATIGANSVIVAASIEAEVATLGGDDQREFLDALGLEEPGLNRVIRAGYSLLQLITFFTAGPKETRAWTVRQGAKAPDGAGTIHTDFARGFIAAEIIAYDDFIGLGGEQACREQGKMRLEGRDYTIRDGDICHFRFNV